jgi:hypothetical protein
MSVELPYHYPMPVEDFIQFLYQAEEISKRAGASQFEAEAAMVERGLQNANRTVYRQAGTGQELALRVHKGPTIAMHLASSSIKQLAPLLLYLRYRAEKGDLLIIDEPELDLHPEAQAKMVEVLAILVNSGINVMAITQSPYIMQHLNNLRYNHLPDEAARRRMARHLYLKDPRAFLSADQVAPYEIRDGKLERLEDPDYGVRWGTLGDVSVDLQNTYYELTKTANGRRR